MSQDDDNLANPEFTGGKILNEAGGGYGAVSRQDIQRRAEELAVIDGLRAQDADERYREQARLEMEGEEVGPEDVLPEAEELDDREAVLGEAGHHVPNVGWGDEELIGEKLFTQGVDEALHDEMRQSSRMHEQEDRAAEAGDRPD